MASHIPAIVLFGDEGLEIYNRWIEEEQEIPEGRRDLIPTALEYKLYEQWYLRGLISQPDEAFEGAKELPTASATETEVAEGEYVRARRCQHPLHPAHPGLVNINKGDEEEEVGEGEPPMVAQWCPTCSMSAHLAFLTVIMEAWSAYGGPWHGWKSKDSPRDARVYYGLMMKAYYRARVAMTNALVGFEEWAQAETAWEAAHPDQDFETFRPYGSAQAILLRDEIHELLSTVVGESEVMHEHGDIVAAASSSQKAHRRSVNWHPDVEENVEKNASGAFWRRCANYNPNSPHACPDVDGWVDTSFKHDYEYCISQSRIMLTYFEPHYDCLIYRDLNIGPNFGNNEHVWRLQLLVQGWLGGMDEEVSRSMSDKIARGSYYWLVLKSDGTTGEDFDRFTIHTSLVDTCVDQYARWMGDIEGNGGLQVAPPPGFEAHQEARQDATMGHGEDEDEDVEGSTDVGVGDAWSSDEDDDDDDEDSYDDDGDDEEDENLRNSTLDDIGGVSVGESLQEEGGYNLDDVAADIDDSDPSTQIVGISSSRGKYNTNHEGLGRGCLKRRDVFSSLMAHPGTKSRVAELLLMLKTTLSVS